MNALRILRFLAADYGRSVEPAPLQPSPGAWADDQITAAWLGHATVLINFFGLRILTDPVFFSRVGLGIGPLIIGPKRYVDCALKPRELPPIDLVLLSHAHMDHLDMRSLRRLAGRHTHVVTAGRTADLLSGLRFGNVQELDWNETRTFAGARPGGEVTLSAFKMRHWGARMRTDDFRRYNAYVIERGGHRLCFAGDTAFTDASALGSRGPVDLFIVPIAAYDPWINAHCTPEEAVRMADQAGARFLLPVHHQTFKLSQEPMGEPIARFNAALSHEPHRVALSQIGETFVLPRTPAPGPVS